MKRCAIIGFGCAGYHAAKAIREVDDQAVIDVYDRLLEPSFNPMLTTYYAAGRLNRAAVFPFGTREGIAQTLRLNLRSGCLVGRVEAANRRVLFDDGQAEYDALLVATGARALIPPFIQVSGGRCFVMRTLGDAERLKAYLDAHPVRTAAVVGASMVGIKVAELLHERGAAVTMIDAAPHIFPLAAYESTARCIEDMLLQRGLSLRLHAKVSAIDEAGVELAGAERVPADIVCLCVGVKANLELVANTEMVKDEVGIQNGILVDSAMQTSAGGVYAAGDCAEGVNLQTGKPAIIGLWANAAAQGRCAGNNMAGRSDAYYGNILHHITHFFDTDFIGLGDPSIPGERLRFDGRDVSIEATVNGMRLESLNLIGNYEISGIFKSYFTKRLLGQRAQLTDAQRAILLSGGLPMDFLNGIGGGI